MVLTKLLRRKRTMRTNVAASRKSTISTPKKNQRKKIKDFTRQQVDRHNNAVGMQVTNNFKIKVTATPTYYLAPTRLS